MSVVETVAAIAAAVGLWLIVIDTVWPDLPERVIDWLDRHMPDSERRV